MVKHKGDIGSKADRFIHEITDWLSSNLGSDNSRIKVKIEIEDNKGNYVYDAERTFK